MDTFNPNQMPPMQGQIENKKSAGPLISVIVILALIIVGGLYFLKERSSEAPYVPAEPDQDEITASLKQQNDSDDLDSIEADLNATNVDNVDQGAAAFQSELEASY